VNIVKVLKDFRTSELSNSQGGECVEVAEVIVVRP
jgi:Domain of unknown function (DUF397)